MPPLRLKPSSRLPNQGPLTIGSWFMRIDAICVATHAEQAAQARRTGVKMNADRTVLAYRTFSKVFGSWPCSGAAKRFTLADRSKRWRDAARRRRDRGNMIVSEPLQTDGREIEPVRHDASDRARTALHRTLQRRAGLSAITGQRRIIDREIRRIAKLRADAPDADQGMLDHHARRICASPAGS